MNCRLRAIDRGLAYHHLHLRRCCCSYFFCFVPFQQPCWHPGGGEPLDGKFYLQMTKMLVTFQVGIIWWIILDILEAISVRYQAIFIEQLLRKGCYFVQIVDSTWRHPPTWSSYENAVFQPIKAICKLCHVEKEQRKSISGLWSEKMVNFRCSPERASNKACAITKVMMAVRSDNLQWHKTRILKKKNKIGHKGGNFADAFFFF